MTTIRLSRPIERRRASDGMVLESISELTIREPTAGDLMEATDEAGVNRPGSLMRALACACAGISRTDFDGLGLEDGAALLGAVGGFLPAGLLTGRTG